MSSTTNTCAADTTRESSPLHSVEMAFAALCTEPKPMALFGAAVHPQLLASWIPLDELRKALITKKYDLHVCDAVWREIVDRSRAEGAMWTVAAAGMAAPALKWVARMYSPDFDGDRDDLDAEILTGFLEHLATIDTFRPAILHRLRYAAQRAGERAAKADATHRKSHTDAESAPPKSPWGHPDLVLNRAVGEGAITEAEADLIGATRLEDVYLAEAAEMLGITVNAAKIRRQRAEARLVAWLTGRPVPSRTALKEARGRSVAGVSQKGSPIAA
ncbi:DNA-directed RNA polymerase specialized sigma24 family protein [Catenulispora sp. GAS73]|uniref:sigma-70 family RNA polymerase sigma factor n=1 Tax=Catenulispora sp. GAS73 TaxID=3156269 RepID=UPI0035156B62